jgi:homoserine O-acetyltransferase/O-succinyltransferase
MRDSKAAFHSTVLVTMALLSCRVACAAPQLFADLGDCKLSNGQVIEKCRIGYRTYGKLNADRSNVVLFPTWYNGQTGDMEGLVGRGRLIDSDNYFVVTIDALGDGVSSSPSNAEAGQRGTRFPKFAIADMVDIEHRLAVEVLHVNHVHAVVGISMGGMQTFEWAARFPHFMNVAIPLMGSPWLTSNDRLTFSIMRTSIQNDPAYQGGQYQREPTLPLANELDTLFAYTPHYRVRITSLEQFPAFLKETDDQETIGANNRVWQIEAIEQLDVLHGAAHKELASRELPKMLIVASRQDHTVNPEPSIEWVKRTGAPSIVLDDDCGHMTAVCSIDKLAQAVSKELAQ